MPRRPCEWSGTDWRLVAHALARTHWHADLDDDRALELLAGIAAREDVAPADLLR